MTASPTIALTPDQETALALILAWLTTEGSNWAMTLQGYAGTGKTTLVQEVARRAPPDPTRLPVVFTAPTNKAVKVLREMAERRDLNVTCMTIHKLLSLKMSDNGEQRVLIKKANEYESMESYRLVVVDEASMISRRLFDQIKEDAERHRTKVLFVGDPLQLPPVEFGAPPAFGLSSAHLTKIVRQAETNPIISMASWLRARLTEERWTNEIELAEADQPGIHLVRDEEFLPAAIDALVNATNHGHDAKAIAWRNATVDQINRGVRAILYGLNPPPYVVGERVMAASPAGSKILYTDCEAKILKIEERRHDDLRKWLCFYLTIRTEDGREDEVPVIHTESKPVLDAELNAIAADAKANSKWRWREYWGLRDSFADLRPCYAITAHRSQGSTYESTWVDAVDILANRDRLEGIKCLYVAITRAARNVYVRDFAL